MSSVENKKHRRKRESKARKDYQAYRSISSDREKIRYVIDVMNKRDKHADQSKTNE